MSIAMPIASIEELDDLELDTRACNRRKKDCDRKAVRVLMRTRTDVQSGCVTSAKCSPSHRHPSNS